MLSSYDTWSRLNWHQSQCTGSYAYSDQYDFMVRPSAVNNNVGQCGDAHYPPNRLASETQEWVYNDHSKRATRCTDWQWGNMTSNGDISCDDWNCAHEGFLVWYMQNAPGLNNDSHGRTGAVRPNWWLYRMPQ